MIKNEQLDVFVAPGPDAYLSPRGPFQNSHNLLHFYGGAGRGEALAKLVWHVQNSDEPFWVRGEAGSGKTLLSLVLANRVKKKFRIVRCDQHSLSADSLLKLLMEDLTGNSWVSRKSEAYSVESDDVVDTQSRRIVGLSSPVLDDIQQTINEQVNDPRPCLLIIDHPGELSIDTRILLGRLNSICRHGYPVFRVVVFETIKPADQRLHPVLDEEPLNNVVYLRRFGLADVQQYLEHHMMLFDYSQRGMFTREMSYFIADRSEGLVREINALVRNAFTLAGIQNEYKLSMSHLLMAGLPEKPEQQPSKVLQVLKNGGFRLAIAAVSTMILVVTLLTVH